MLPNFSNFVLFDFLLLQVSAISTCEILPYFVPQCDRHLRNIESGNWCTGSGWSMTTNCNFSCFRRGRCIFTIWWGAMVACPIDDWLHRWRTRKRAMKSALGLRGRGRFAHRGAVSAWPAEIPKILSPLPLDKHVNLVFARTRFTGNGWAIKNVSRMLNTFNRA